MKANAHKKDNRKAKGRAAVRQGAVGPASKAESESKAMSDVEIFWLDVYRVQPREIPAAEAIEPEGGALTITPRLRAIFSGPFSGAVGRSTKLQPFHFQFDGADRQNAARELVKRVLSADSAQHEAACRELAWKLSRSIDRRVGELLLTVAVGRTAEKQRCVLWAYPSDSPLQFKVGKGKPEVEEVQNAFSKSSNMRKAIFLDAPARLGRNSLTKGLIVDRTANRLKGSSDYWLEKFLEGIIELRPARGTNILIRCLRDSQAKATTPAEKASVNAVVNRLLSGAYPATTLREVAFTLVGNARAAFEKTLPDTVEADATFKIDASVVSQKIKSLVFVLKGGIQVLLPLDGSVDSTDLIENRNGVRFLVMDEEIEDELFK